MKFYDMGLIFAIAAVVTLITVFGSGYGNGYEAGKQEVYMDIYQLQIDKYKADMQEGE